MRARILFGGLLPVALAACSEPAARPALERNADATLSARPNLAFSAPAGTDIPVASDLEINLPKSEPERPRTLKPRRKPAPVASEPVVQPVTEPAQVEVPHDHAVRPDSAPALISTTMPAKIEEQPRASAPPAQPSPEPSAPGADDRGTPRPDDAMDGGRPGRGPGVIVVRGGGSGGGHDPCRIHDMGPRGIASGVGGGIGGPAGVGIHTGVGRDAGGVLINDRTPRIGGGSSRGGRFYSRGMGR